MKLCLSMQCSIPSRKTYNQIWPVPHSSQDMFFKVSALQVFDVIEFCSVLLPSTVYNISVGDSPDAGTYPHYAQSVAAGPWINSECTHTQCYTLLSSMRFLVLYWQVRRYLEHRTTNVNHLSVIRATSALHSSDWLINSLIQHHWIACASSQASTYRHLRCFRD